MQSSTVGRLCTALAIDLRRTYSCPKKGEHYIVLCNAPPQAGRDVGAPQRDEIGSGVKPCV